MDYKNDKGFKKWKRQKEFSEFLELLKMIFIVITSPIWIIFLLIRQDFLRYEKRQQELYNEYLSSKK